MQLLTLNAGSSSLKFALYQDADGQLVEQARGNFEGIGARPRLRMTSADGRIWPEMLWEASDAPVGHQGALEQILAWLGEAFPGVSVAAVGHRVVHGGPRFAAPVLLSDETVRALEDFVPLAPLHQPHNLAGVAAARAAFPEARQIACFDTAFHRGHPWVNDTFALPRQYYDEGVRRYGFHGLSYEYVAQELRRIAPMLAAGRCVVAHLGNGASMCALLDGQSVGSTMGFSALDGLPMGTRCGQIDPGVLLYLMQTHDMSAEDLTNLLYRDSGLRGLSGLSHDMRTLEASDSREAAEAIDYFVFRIRRELGAMTAVLGGLDALVFCGGIGENAAGVRARICEGFGWLGLELDRHRNDAGGTVVSTDLSRVRALVIRTDEEAMIARHTRDLLRAST